MGSYRIYVINSGVRPGLAGMDQADLLAREAEILAEGMPGLGAEAASTDRRGLNRAPYSTGVHIYIYIYIYT